MPISKTAKREAWTIVMDPILKQALKMKAATSKGTASDFIDRAVFAFLDPKEIRAAKRALKQE